MESTAQITIVHNTGCATITELEQVIDLLEKRGLLEKATVDVEGIKKTLEGIASCQSTVSVKDIPEQLKGLSLEWNLTQEILMEACRILESIHKHLGAPQFESIDTLYSANLNKFKDSLNSQSENEALTTEQLNVLIELVRSRDWIEKNDFASLEERVSQLERRNTVYKSEQI